VVLVVQQSCPSFQWLLFMSRDRWNNGVMTMGKSSKILSLGSVKELLAPFLFGLFSCRGVGGAVEFLSVVLQSCQSICRVANLFNGFL